MIKVFDAEDKIGLDWTGLLVELGWLGGRCEARRGKAKQSNVKMGSRAVNGRDAEDIIYLSPFRDTTVALIMPGPSHKYCCVSEMMNG